jgi:hypothetical protein
VRPVVRSPGPYTKAVQIYCLTQGSVAVIVAADSQPDAVLAQQAKIACMQAVELPAQETVPSRVDFAHPTHRRDHDRAEASGQPGVRFGDLENRRIRELHPSVASKVRRGFDMRRHPQASLVAASNGARRIPHFLGGRDWIQHCYPKSNFPAKIRPRLPERREFSRFPDSLGVAISRLTDRSTRSKICRGHVPSASAV